MCEITQQKENIVIQQSGKWKRILLIDKFSFQKLMLNGNFILNSSLINDFKIKQQVCDIQRNIGMYA